jgi:hypothetical protein
MNSFPRMAVATDRKAAPPPAVAEQKCILKPWLPPVAEVAPSRNRDPHGRERTMSRQRLECVELAPALMRPSPSDSAPDASGDAFHTLREPGRRQPLPPLPEPASADKKIGINFCTSPQGLFKAIPRCKSPPDHPGPELPARLAKTRTRRVAFRPAVGTRKPNTRRWPNIGTMVTKCNPVIPVSHPGPTHERGGDGSSPVPLPACRHETGTRPSPPLALPPQALAPYPTGKIEAKPRATSLGDGAAPSAPQNHVIRVFLEMVSSREQSRRN